MTVEAAATRTTQRNTLRLLSYNVQVGIRSGRPFHYVTNVWKHVLPARCRFSNMSRIAELLHDFDIVALQELDAGSHRTRYVNMTQYLADEAGFPFWYHQINRDLGKVAQHGNGLLSRIRPLEVTEHRLPGMIPGRGGLMARFGNNQHDLVVMLLHLALSKRARLRQLAYISELINEHEHVVLMGDMNCEPNSPEMNLLFKRTRLCEPEQEQKTFPSWRPIKNIDHILVTSELSVTQCHVFNHAYSDHLPVAMDIALPEDLQQVML